MQNQAQKKNVTISLRCPISSKRIRVPVKGPGCVHYQCFDKRSMELLFMTPPIAHKMAVKCAVCSSLIPTLESLVFDEMFIEILSCTSPQTINVVITIDNDSIAWKSITPNTDNSTPSSVSPSAPTSKYHHNNSKIGKRPTKKRRTDHVDLTEECIYDDTHNTQQQAHKQANYYHRTTGYETVGIDCSDEEILSQSRSQLSSPSSQEDLLSTQQLPFTQSQQTQSCYTQQSHDPPSDLQSQDDQQLADQSLDDDQLGDQQTCNDQVESQLDEVQPLQDQPGDEQLDDQQNLQDQKMDEGNQQDEYCTQQPPPTSTQLSPSHSPKSQSRQTPQTPPNSRQHYPSTQTSSPTHNVQSTCQPTQPAQQDSAQIYNCDTETPKRLQEKHDKWRAANQWSKVMEIEKQLVELSAANVRLFTAIPKKTLINMLCSAHSVEWKRKLEEIAVQRKNVVLSYKY